MKFEDWDAFETAATKLFLSSPLRTRYVVKYRHCDSALVLKVTNDKVCLKFTTNQITNVRKMEKLNNRFFFLMTTSDKKLEDAADDPRLIEAATAAVSESSGGAPSSPAKAAMKIRGGKTKKR